MDFTEIISVHWRNGQVMKLNSGSESQGWVSVPEWMRLRQAIDDYFLSKLNQELQDLNSITQRLEGKDGL